MRLTRLHIHCVRNLREVILTPHPHFNLFLGENGSGKTSLLEAIYFLGLGRSFRSRHIQHVISYHQEALACFGEALDAQNNVIPIGIEKNQQGEIKCKVRGEPCERLSHFATTLPLQLITPESFKLLLASPEERRRYLDWGVFHVEHLFAALCQRYQRLLKQRNAALKQGHRGHWLPWDKELIEAGEKIAVCRQTYWKGLLPFWEKMKESLLPEIKLAVYYEPGWDPKMTLEEALLASTHQDQRLGYTTVGPHRADITFTHEKFPASHSLSRGQQKLLICGLYLAQAEHLLAQEGKKCLFLLDDLASELDSINRGRILKVLAQQGHQVFFTGVEPQAWLSGSEGLFQGSVFEVEKGEVASMKMFHVEHSPP